MTSQYTTSLVELQYRTFEMADDKHVNEALFSEAKLFLTQDL